MEADKERSTFDRMVSTISSDERKDMLDKVSKASKEEDSLKRSLLSDSEEDYKVSLTVRLQQESFLKRLWIKIKSAFFSIPPEEAYNTSLIAHIAREIEHIHPGLISHKRGLLTVGTYEKLYMIRKVQEFFMPYIESYERNPGLYYYYLSLIVMPEITEEIEKSSDPYKFPFTKNLTSETRVQLIKKIEDSLDALPEVKRSSMYMCVRSVEWLKAFNRMYVDSLVKTFSSSKECAYHDSRSDFVSIAKIMKSVNIPSNEALSALFSLHYNTTSESPDKTKEEHFIKEFLTAANLHAEEIRNFSSSVPVRDLARLIFNNALYDSASFGGGEDWFVKFKSQWRSNFDVRWNQWLFDYKKYRLQIKVKTYFDYDNLPLLPFRPWVKVHKGYSFKYELSMGFLWQFFNTAVRTAESVLKTVMLEGDFSIKENAGEFADDFRFLQSVRDEFASLNASLSSSGEITASLLKTAHASDKEASHISFNSIMSDLEERALSFIDRCGKWFRSMKALLAPIVNGSDNQYYAGLTNLSKLGGRQNKEFRESLSSAFVLIEHAYDILTESEGLDSNTA